MAEFARMHGVSKTAVGKWKEQGFLRLRDGKVLVRESDSSLCAASLGRYSDARRAAAKVQASAEKRKPERSTSGPLEGEVSTAAEVAEEAAGDDDGLAQRLIDDGDQFADFVEMLLDGRYASIAVSEQVKAHALAIKRLSEARHALGILVEVAVAETVLFEQARIWRDAWMNFPTRIGPLLAADLGVEPGKLVELLTAHVHQQIADLGEPEADFAPEDDATG